MLRDQKGIHSVKVALLAERAVVEYDPLHWNVEKLVGVSSCPLEPKGSFSSHCCRKFPILASMQLIYRKQERMWFNYEYMA